MRILQLHCDSIEYTPTKKEIKSAEDIDKAMVLGYKHPMGPLKLTDLVGLDVRRDILLNLQRSFNDDRYAPHPLLEEMVEKGQLGKKSGQGFFEW